MACRPNAVPGRVALGEGIRHAPGTPQKARPSRHGRAFLCPDSEQCLLRVLWGLVAPDRRARALWGDAEP